MLPSPTFTKQRRAFWTSFSVTGTRLKSKYILSRLQDGKSPFSGMQWFCDLKNSSLLQVFGNLKKVRCIQIFAPTIMGVKPCCNGKDDL